MTPELRCLLLAATDKDLAMRASNPCARLLDRAERNEVLAAEGAACTGDNWSTSVPWRLIART